MQKRVVVALNQDCSVKDANIMSFQRRQELPFPVALQEPGALLLLHAPELLAEPHDLLVLWIVATAHLDVIHELLVAPDDFGLAAGDALQLRGRERPEQHDAVAQHVVETLAEGHNLGLHAVPQPEGRGQEHELLHGLDGEGHVLAARAEGRAGD